MADNFLEKQRADYEQRKAQWFKKKRLVRTVIRTIDKPEDESL
jgi:hypothetical protein